MLPFLTVVVELGREPLLSLAALLWIAAGSVLPFMVWQISEWTDQPFHLPPWPPLFNGLYGYLFLGVWLGRLRPAGRLILPATCLAVLGTVATLVLTLFTSLNGNLATQAHFGYTHPAVVAAASGVFILLRSNAIVFPTRFSQALAPLTFGVYLIHPIFIELISLAAPLWVKGSAVWIPLAALAVALFSFVTCSVIAQAPVLRRLIPQ